MALSKTSMKNRIKANLVARNGNLDATNLAILEPYLEDICDGIIEEIKANIQITISTPGVQAGASTVNGTNTVVS